MDTQKIIEEIKRHMNGPTSIGLAQRGIEYKVNYGVTIPELQQIAQQYMGNHQLAQDLYKQDIRECKIIASMIDNPADVTGEQIDDWAQSFTNVEIVEQVCSNLIWKTDCALSRSIEWCLGDDELIQKAGLIIAARCASNTNIKDKIFAPYIDVIGNYEYNQIAQNKSSIEFALRQIAHRSEDLRIKVVVLAKHMASSYDEHSAWIGGQLLFNFGDEQE